MLDLPARLRSIREHADGGDVWRVADIAPPPPLEGLIDGYGDYLERTTSFTTRRELPHAQAVLIVNLAAPLTIMAGDGRETVLRAGEAFVAGAHLRPALSRSTGEQAGMHVFLSLPALRRLLGVPMDELRDQVVPLDGLLGRSATAFCRALAETGTLHERVALLDTALIRRFAAMPALPSAQARAVGLLRERPQLDIAGAAKEIGWSRKHFAARVGDALGVGPRSYRRLLRFERLTTRLREAPAADRALAARTDWANLALDAGYCDQSHLIREFREFAGMTPGEYLRRSLPDGGGVVES